MRYTIMVVIESFLKYQTVNVTLYMSYTIFLCCHTAYEQSFNSWQVVAGTDGLSCCLPNLDIFLHVVLHGLSQIPLMQSSCTRSELEAESKQTNNILEYKQSTERNFSIPRHKNVELNGQTKIQSYFSLSFQLMMYNLSAGNLLT